MKTGTLIVSCACIGLSSFADTVANGITTVAPSSVTQGVSGVVVTMTLDSTAIPPPPPSKVPDNMRIGSIEGYSISRSGYDCTATFDIPVGETAGFKTAEVYFADDEDPPPELSFQKANGFEVLPAGDQPVVGITTGTTVVSNDVTSITINGTNNTEVVGSLVWSNSLTGAYGSIPVSGTSFAVSNITLYVGGNIIAVSGTNDAGVVAVDTASIGRLPSSDSTPLPYTVVDTGQDTYYDNSSAIAAPAEGAGFYGQDAQVVGVQPAYINMGNGTVLDVNTGLTWTQTPDLTGDGTINTNDKLTQSAAAAYAATLNTAGFGGHSDWRLPSIKEIYSLMDFRGTDPMSDDTSTLVPFIDTDYFDFGYGDTANGERTIDAQFATTTIYVDTVMNNQTAMFGLNLADGRIKGYPTVSKTYYVLFCRGNTAYGTNDFENHGDGTVTDHATGLMWQQADSGTGMLWSNALAYADGFSLAGYDDWRLPNAKELQSLLDYTRSPGITASAAIDPVFSCTAITNEEGEADYPWYFTGTTHARQDGSGSSAVYVCFGRSMGYMNSEWMDVHGAGSQRSDSKEFDTTGYTYVTDGWYFTQSPQGDAARWYNHVRLVRDAVVPDSDGDGMSDSDEAIAGMDPYDAGSLFKAGISQSAITWPSAHGRSYRVIASSDLADVPFNTVVASNLTATPPENTYPYDTATHSNVFYRLEVE